MKILGRVFLFMLICAVSAAALVLLFPFLKEGASRGELPLLLSVAAGLTALGVVWWLLGGQALAKGIGLAVLALPLAGHLIMAGQLVAAQLRGAGLAKAVTVESYRETPIEWDGFEGPVGLTIELELSHPAQAPGLIYPPEVRMGRTLEIPNGVLVSTLTSGGGYFKDHYLSEEVGSLALLKTVLFQGLHEPRESHRGFEPGKSTHLAYHLYPGTIQSLESEERNCLVSESAGLDVCEASRRPEDGCRLASRRGVERPLYHGGDDLSAIWLVAGGYDMVADLSAQLTETLRRKSALQGDPEAWTAMQLRLEPDGLRAAGYGLCPKGPRSHSAFQVCFCRS
jgi:hypothetical protein